MIDYLTARLEEPTTKTALAAFLTAVGAPIAAGQDLHTCLCVGVGAALPAFGAAFTRENGARR